MATEWQLYGAEGDALLTLVVRDEELTQSEWRAIACLVPHEVRGWHLYRPEDERPLMTHEDRQYLINEYIGLWRRTC